MRAGGGRGPANGSSSHGFCYVSSDGNANVDNAGGTGGVCFGFYI